MTKRGCVACGKCSASSLASVLKNGGCGILSVLHHCSELELAFDFCCGICHRKTQIQ